MGARFVVELHPATDHALRLKAVRQVVEVDGFVLQRTPQALDEHVVHAPAPAIHRALRPDASTRSVNARLVNCAPWSMLNISGAAPPDSAASSASTQNAAPIVFDSRHDSTQCVTATRYRNPRRTGM